MKLQKTLAKKITLVGKGLHTGRIVKLDILPADDDFGIVFHRTDVDDAHLIRAVASNISVTELSTSLGLGASRISTVEHLMAALAGCEIDNALIQVNGPEMPIMDGSSQIFVEAICAAGFRFGRQFRKALALKKPFEVRDGDKFLRFSPAEQLQIHCTIDFPQQVIGRQHMEYTHAFSEFVKVANSRTFCQFNDVKIMQENGLALGGSLENAIVIHNDQIMNNDGLRHEDEFVRHKLLDLIGDLYLLGSPLLANVEAFKSGHGLHANATRYLLAHAEEYFDIVLAPGTNRVNEINRSVGPVPMYAFG